MKEPRQDYAFTRFLKFWRDVHQLSQEELADQLDCSSRHISRLETGSSRPSEAMVIQIGQVLNLGKRDLNHLLISAGYSPLAEEHDFDSPELRWLRKSMVHTLRALDPYPASLVDTHSNILMVNRGFVSLFSRVVPAELLDRVTNNLEFIFWRSGGSNLVSNWEDTLSAILMAGQQDALFSNNPDDQSKIDQLAERMGVPEDWRQRAAKMEPMSSFRVQVEVNGELKTFFNVSTIVSPSGPAAFVSEPRLTINILYPEDEALDLAGLQQQAPKHPLLFY